MVIGTQQGLTRAKEVYQNRTQQIRASKAAGKKVMGYLCLYPVVEMMTAVDLIPYRIFGDMKEPITKSDTYIPTVVCPFLRSCLDLGLKDKYDFLDGVAMSHSCDVVEKLAHIWTTFVKTPNAFFIDTPHTIHEAAIERQKEILKDFKTHLESTTGKKLTIKRLKEAIEAHNQQRTLVRELYDLRKPDPPLISGTETLQTIVSLMSLPVDEGNKLLREVISEVKVRKNGPQKKSARLLVWGSILDDISVIEMIESFDANVVMDDTCVGSRAYFADVKMTKDPLDGLAYHYLVELKCPRTMRETVFGETRRDYMSELENRFGYLKEYAKGWKANGAILQIIRYCDSHGYELPEVKDYLDSIGLPNIYIEHDYSKAALAPLRTRVQGFLELIG